MERGLRSPAFAADSLGSNALFSLDRALICADIHPLTMHAFYGISAQPLFCQRLRSTSSAIAVYRPFVSSLAWPKTRNFKSAPSVVVAERGPALQLTNKAQHHSLADLLGRLNAALRGWCGYFGHGVSKATFGYLDSYAWHRVTQWLLKRHKHLNWAELYRRFLTGRPGHRPAVDRLVMFDATTMPVTRYRWRASNIPTPWTSNAETLVPA
jgi:Group II intron, maturase-specific domain